ncbi:MAG: argininosuccinate synthase [Acidobacteria bacterium]|nr:argininosuccinate synthase [Acidobacteriota bacterium]
MTRRTVFAYTGSLHTSMAIRTLAEVDDGEVVTLTLDLGQGVDLEEVRDRALATGAVRAHVLDAREEFARDFVLPALRAGAQGDGNVPMGEMLAWPLIARKLVEIASVEQATEVAHGCSGADLERLRACVVALAPALEVVAAGCGDGARRAHGNLWGRAHAAGAPRAKAPDNPAHIEIGFDEGVPSAINGVPMPLVELIESVSVIAGRYGVGWIDALGPDPVEDGDRRYEAPAAAVLHAARAALEASVLPPELLERKRSRAVAYAQVATEGRWFGEERKTMDAVNMQMEDKVTGSVRIKLFHGTLHTSEAASGSHVEAGRV